MINIAADVASMRIDKFATMTAAPPTVEQPQISCIRPTWSEILQQPMKLQFIQSGDVRPKTKQVAAANNWPSN